MKSKKQKSAKSKAKKVSQKRVAKLFHDVLYPKTDKILSAAERKKSAHFIKLLDQKCAKVNALEAKGKIKAAAIVETNFDRLLKKHNDFLAKAFKRANAEIAKNKKAKKPTAKKATPKVKKIRAKRAANVKKSLQKATAKKQKAPKKETFAERMLKGASKKAA